MSPFAEKVLAVALLAAAVFAFVILPLLRRREAAMTVRRMLLICAGLSLALWAAWVGLVWLVWRAGGLA